MVFVWAFHTALLNVFQEDFRALTVNKLRPSILPTPVPRVELPHYHVL